MELVVPLPSPDAVYRVRASGPSLVHGIVDTSNAPRTMPPNVLVLVGNATPSSRYVRMRLPIAGMYTIEALRLYDTFERDNHARCVRRNVHAPELLARVLVPDTTSVSRSPHWFARMGTIDPETLQRFIFRGGPAYNGAVRVAEHSTGCTVRRCPRPS